VLTLAYNSRLQPQLFKVNGRNPQVGTPTLMHSEYSYEADGRIRSVRDLTDERFDSAYQYDHVGRLREAYSGSEARDFLSATQSGTVTGPYRQTYLYDAFDNLTRRENRFWSEPDTYTANYDAAQRNALWGYDDAGQVTRDESRNYRMDAAGHVVTQTAVNDASASITQGFDGRGQRIKQVRRTPNRFGSVITTTSYELRSTVLGSRVVVELGSNGQKSASYVYAASMVLAVRRGQSVEWVTENPVTGSRQQTSAEGRTMQRVEADPMGIDVGTTDPYAEEGGGIMSAEEPGQARLMPQTAGGTGQCRIDGMSAECALANSLLSSGAAVHAPVQTVTSLYMRFQGRTYNLGLVIWNANAAEAGFGIGHGPASMTMNSQFAGWVRAGFNFVGNGVTIPGWAAHAFDGGAGQPGASFYTLGQFGGATTGARGDVARHQRQEQSSDVRMGNNANFTDDERKILDEVRKRINQKDCRDWVNKKLKELGAPPERNTLDKLLNLARFNKYDSDLSTGELGIDADSAITLLNWFKNYDDKPAATVGNQVFMVDLAFKRNSITIPGTDNRDIDTATVIVHELFHVAGYKELVVGRMNQMIHNNCGFKGMSY
jgi:hypothetical protein